VAVEQKIKRDAFLYLNPDGDKQCGTCRDWIKNHDRCYIHAKDVVVPGTASCGFYVHGDPIANNPTPLGAVTPEESGLVDRPVRCENCVYGGPGVYECELFHTLNAIHADFALDTAIEPKGCCNAQTPGTREETETD
jgi:hypothetical protein